MFSISSLSMLGRAGVPGSNDLETALRRLSIRKANDIHDRSFIEEQEEKRKKAEQRYAKFPKENGNG